MKRFYRVSEGKVIAGVCAGLGKYFDMDPLLIRIAFLVFIIFAGAGIWMYILLALLAPVE